MFKQLRNRFLMMNLVTISVMMLIAFASIYMITYNNVRGDIDRELHQTSDWFNKPLDNAGGRGRPMREPQLAQPANGINMPPDRSISFAVRTDDAGNILTVSSRFDADTDFYEAAVQYAALQNKNTGQLNLDGNEWAFMKQAAPNGNGSLLVFVDVTARQGILTNLIYTFIAVALVMLVIIFFISRYFANRSIAPVQEAFNKQKQFIADASHELKTPLAVIHTNVDAMLANEDEPIRRQTKWLHYIKSEADRMAKLTADLLYLTEMDEARTRMIFRPFSVSETVENVILTMEAVIFEKNLTLQYEIEPDLTTYGSSEQIGQVTMILLDNAMKYTNANGMIGVSLTKQHHDIILSVANTGEGIAPEHVDRIFDRFYRTDPSRARKQGGYGLGLAIAKSIVEQHKGSIRVKSIPGERTVFTVSLPYTSVSQ